MYTALNIFNNLCFVFSRMAGNDGATTELFTGWSSVVHQPEDEPEESELPSTVDIGALSAEPAVPNPTQNNAESDSESEDSDGDSSVSFLFHI